MTKSVFRLWAVILIAGVAMAASPPSHAGFEWTPPAETGAGGVEVPAASLPPAPVPEVEAMPVAAAPPPVPVVPVSEQPAAPQQETAASAPLPAVVDQQPVVASSPPVVSGALAASPEPVVEGFGTDIPLALVMQQVVPAGYAYSFDSGIDPGQRVSWKGGRPWPAVLAEAVAPRGLDVEVVDNTVWLRIAEVPLAAVPAAVAAESPPAAASGFPAALMKADDPVQPVPAQIAADIPAEAAVFTPPPIEQPRPLSDYSAEELSAIGANASGYTPSYPRRHPDQMSFEKSPGVSDNVSRTANLRRTVDGNKPLAAAPKSALTGASVPSSQGGDQHVPTSAAEDPATEASVDAPAPSSVSAGVMDPYEIRFWQAAAGDDLKATLEKWGSLSSVSVVWDSPTSFKIPTPVTLHGTFPDAVMEVLTAFNDIKPRPTGVLHPNLPTGPSVLIVGGENLTN